MLVLVLVLGSVVPEGCIVAGWEVGVGRCVCVSGCAVLVLVLGLGLGFRAY